MKHYVIMFFMSAAAGLLSSMWVYVDSWRDIRVTLNDLYMATLMSFWMIFFMGVYDWNLIVTVIALLGVVASLVAIRTQFRITQTEYLRGMIPHHSMAIMMSRRLKEKEHTIGPFLDTIIMTQGKEIGIMKDQLARSVPAPRGGRSAHP